MSIRPIGLALAVALASSVGLGGLPPALSAEGCSAAAPIVRLDGFPQESVYPQPFYWVGEEDTSGTVWITASGGCGITIGVSYAGEARTADADDFTLAPGRVELATPLDDGPESDDIPVSIEPDLSPEPVAEWFDIVLSDASPPVLDAPSTAPMFILDDDGGSSRVAFGLPTYSQSETYPRAVIPVFRGGDANSSHSVNVTVTPGPTNPATPGEDFIPPISGSVTFAPGDRVETIELQIVNDKVGEAAEDVTISLVGASVEAPSSTVLTIIDNEENVPPRSRFHHPRNRWRYNKADYRIREFHIFATDEGGSEVVAAEMALRRNLKNGKCAWKVKKGWQKKDCQNRTWLPTKYDDTGELFYYRMKQLKSSVGTKIKDYTAFSRAIDGAGNVEKQFNKKRNMNTFEIKRKGKTQKA